MPLSRPQDECFEKFNAYKSRGRSCLKHHLGEGCDEAGCSYDHSEAGENVLSVLRFIMQTSVACSDRGACRRVNCCFGHGCSKEGCGDKGCRFKADTHDVDQEIHHWEMGTLRYRNKS
jgi:hypothetical protein